MSFDEASIVPLRAVVSEVIDNRGKTPPTQNRGNALIEINAINAERKYPNYEMVKKYVSDEIYQTWFRKGHPQKNDVLIPTVGTIGSVAFVNESHGCIAQNIISLRCNESKCLGEFLYYYLKLNSSRMAMLGLDIGSVQPSIKVPHLMNMAIRIPSVKKQRAIAATLSALDDKIELNNRINKTLEEMAQALFKQWFVDFEFPDENGQPYKSSGGEMEESELGPIPKGWRVVSLGEVTDFYNGYAFKSGHLLDENIGACYHVFKMGHIYRGGGLNKMGTKSYIGKEACKDLQKYVLKKGDLLMCMTDMKSNVALLGYTALMDEDNKYIVNQRVGLLRVKNKNLVNYPFLYVLTNSSDFVENLRSRANSGVQVNLSTYEIKASKLWVPDEETHKKFDNIVCAYYERIFVLQKENETLTSIRDALLPKLMSGEIRVPIEEVSAHV